MIWSLGATVAAVICGLSIQSGDYGWAAFAGFASACAAVISVMEIGR